MAIEVIQFAKPHLWASLVAGGSLTVAQTYYFIGFAFRGSGYYGEANSPASEEISLTPTAGNQTIKIEWWQDGGNVTAYANPGGGQVTVTTAAAHGRSNGDTAYIRGTTNYDGTYTIANVAATTFEITAVWVADDGASKWFADIGFHTRANGMGFKWDKYTMIDAGDGKPYQWQNMNDPALGGTEFDTSQGHRKWTIYMHTGSHPGNSINFTQEATSTTYVQGYLYDGLALSYNNIGGWGFSLLDCAWRKTSYDIDSSFPEDQGKLCIYCTGTGNTVSTLILALRASGYDDMYILGMGNYGWSMGATVTILGSVFTDSGSDTVFEDCTIDLIGGQFCYGSYSSVPITVNRSKIIQHSISYYQWSNPKVILNDSEFFHIGSALIPDNMSGVNFTPKSYNGGITIYSKTPSGLRMIGGYGTRVNFQWRYQRTNSSSHLQNFYIKDFYLYIANQGASDYTGKMTNVEFANDGLQNRDVYSYWGYVTGTANKIMDCLNVSCDRADGKITVYNQSSVHAITDLWNMWFVIDLTILDEAGNAINGADINLSWSSGSDTDTSDVSGIAEVTVLSYTINWDNTMGAGNGVTSAYNDLTLIVKKAGYQTHKSTFTVSEGKDWNITLKRSAICIDQEVIT